MSTTPAGSLSLAQENLRNTLATCPAMRAWLGVATAEAALLKIFHEGPPSPANGLEYDRNEWERLRPYATVWTEPRNGFARALEAEGDAFWFASQGRLRLRLYQNAPAGHGGEPASDANLQFRNAVGAIIDDLCALAGQPGYFAFHRLAVENGPYWTHPDLIPSHGLWIGIELSFDWKGV